MLTPANIKHFYIPDEQSIYLLSHTDAKKLKDWFKLCTEQLLLLGYQNIELIGKGAFGFAFAGTVLKVNTDQNTHPPQQQVFKFSRINLPQHVQDRFEEEAYMLSLVNHPYVPRFIEYQR
ncbi:MAG: non-specific serine/threonine protein kinase, partial [Paraglaciecola sp.]